MVRDGLLGPWAHQCLAERHWEAEDQKRRCDGGPFILVSFSVEGTMSSLLWSPTWGTLTMVTTVPTSGVLKMENGSASTTPMFLGWEASSQTASCRGFSISNGFWARTGGHCDPDTLRSCFLWRGGLCEIWSPLLHGAPSGSQLCYGLLSLASRFLEFSAQGPATLCSGLTYEGKKL